MSEYRLEELALEANTTVRNIRAYRDRGLLPPPRRQGRVALYSDAHLGRLRLVAELLDRGYTLNSIRELLVAWEKGRDIADVLGLEQILTTRWSDEEPITVSRSELDHALGTAVGDADLAVLLGIGLVERIALDPASETRGIPMAGPGDGPEEMFRLNSPRQVQAGIDLVRAGIALPDVLDQARFVHEAMERVAEQFVALVTRSLFDPLGDIPPASELARLTATVERLRPLAAEVVAAELARSMERLIQQDLGDRLGRILPMPATSVPAATDPSRDPNREPDATRVRSDPSD